MSNDPQGLLDVNRACILECALSARQRQLPGDGRPLVVVCAATWGRGSHHPSLLQLKQGTYWNGYNSSIVAAPDPDVAQLFVSLPTEKVAPSPNSYLVVCSAYGKTYQEWWSFDEHESEIQLF